MRLRHWTLRGSVSIYNVPYCYKGACNNGTGSCECQEGWYGVHCDHYCNSTTSIDYGKCRKDGLGCDCEPGWYGTRCEQLCNSRSAVTGTAGRMARAVSAMSTGMELIVTSTASVAFMVLATRITSASANQITVLSAMCFVPA